GIHARDLLHRAVNAADVDRLAEDEIAGVEKAEGAVRQGGVAQYLCDSVGYIATEMVGADANVKIDLERHEARRPKFQVVAGQTVRRQKCEDGLLESGGELSEPVGQVDQVC